MVVHKDHQIDALSSTELRRIFLGKRKTWPDGTVVLPVLNPSDTVHADFSRNMLFKSPQQLSTYWRKNLYSGRSMMPYKAESVVDLTDYMNLHKNAISYLSTTELVDTLKPIRIEQ